ncbi:hypothetical protein Q4485_02065 [Granulosicoccaceae sp. 1_MG-2023]|nr:hypothetical protein [Granulosicoccaceae sp. 1_MG-2023]
MSLLKHLGLLFVLLLPAACGFAPRGSITQSTDIGTVYIAAGKGVSIGRRLGDSLRERNISVTEFRDQATILVNLSNEQKDQRIVSVESTGRVSEYELRHSVDMQIARSIDGAKPQIDKAQKANTVTVIREYTYDRTGVLGKADEAQILRSEMQDELVMHLVLRLLASVRQTSATDAVESD